MAELPNLKGVATKDLVETIGTGSFKAAYINWSRTMQLFRDHAPGWMIEPVFSPDGGLLHKAPVGGYLLFRLRHLDGTVTPEVPQAVMDNRNNSIAYEKITARDITDTHRRGGCLVLAYTTGLGHELWAKMPLESGYQVADEETIQKAKASAQPNIQIQQKPVPTKKDFVKLATDMGLVEPAIKDLISKINENYETGIKTLKSKDADFVLKMNEQFQAAQY